MHFRATVELGGKTATGIHVPDGVVEALGTSKRPAVTVTIGPHTYRTTVARMGGRFLIPLSAENRTAAQIAAGDEVDVHIALDGASRVVEVPADLAAELAADRAAKDAFDALPYSHRKEHVRSIEDAKKPETRTRRLAKTLETLRSKGR